MTSAKASNSNDSAYSDTGIYALAGKQVLPFPHPRSV